MRTPRDVPKWWYRKPPVDQSWETSLGTCKPYKGVPIFLVRLASNGKVGMATLTPEDPIRKPFQVEWAWGTDCDILTSDPVPDWLEGLIDSWID